MEVRDMLEVVGTIVNEQRTLVGLVIEGKPADFGEIGTGKVRKPIEIASAKKLLHNCKNFTVSGGRIEGVKEKNRLCYLQMYDLAGNEVDNEIDLTKKIVTDGKIIGFDVLTKFNKSMARYRYQDVVTLCGWFKPGNFIVKYTSDGKAFISGKPGKMKLEELPTEEILKPSKRAANRKDGAVKNPVVNKRTGVIDTNRIDSVMKNSLDIFTILDAINSCDGLVIYLDDSDNKYENTLDTKVKTGDDFVPLNIGLIGVPYPDYSIDKMKVNIKFKKPGFVSVDEFTKAYAYTYSTRTIIKNGVNYIKRVGIAVSKEKAPELVSYFNRCGGELHLTRLNDEKTIKGMEALNGKRGLEYFVCDLSKVGVMSKKKIESSKADTDTVSKLVKQLAYNKGCIKGLKEAIKVYAGPEALKDKSVSPMYAGYNDDMLAKVAAAGIDIHTGAYTVTVATDKESKGTDSTETPISVQYSIAKFNINGVTAKDMFDDNDKANKNAVYCMIKNKYGKLSEYVRRDIKGAKEELKKLDAENHKIEKKLWEINAAMLQETGYKRVYKGHGDLWREVPSRSKNGRKYECVSNAALTMTVTGVEVG